MSTATPEPENVTDPPENGTPTPVSVTHPDDPGTRGRRNGYLPVLPEGWTYTVNVSGPAGRVSVYPATEDTDPGEWVVNVHPSGGKPRALPAESLADGIRQAADAVKALARLAKVEEEYQAARKAALAAFGDDEDES